MKWLHLHHVKPTQSAHLRMSMKDGVWDVLARIPARQDSTTKGKKRWEQLVPQVPGLANPSSPFSEMQLQLV